jgi:ABC-2 type transport system ATP-binding protein
MEEAERVAHYIAIIDRGQIIVQGTSDELKEKTGTTSLEDAFIALTGHDLRVEEASPLEHMRVHRRFFAGRRR